LLPRGSRAARSARVQKESAVADRQYELVYILPPDTTEQQVTELHGQIEAVVTRLNGAFDRTENWGRKRLAYEIGPHKEGVYVLEVINGSGELMKELDRRLKVMDQVIRHMVVRVDEEKKVVERTQTRRRTSSERRRVKRGLPPQRQPGEGRPAGEPDDAEDDRFDGVEV
jgi:small subunit ribosomal protein S6